VPSFLKERLKQTIRDLTPEEHRRRTEGETVNPYTVTPNGELALQLGDSYPMRAASDTKKKRLEECLNAFMEVLMRRAYDEKRRRSERELEEERRREAEPLDPPAASSVDSPRRQARGRRRGRPISM
jgi:hypothetical protein